MSKERESARLTKELEERIAGLGLREKELEGDVAHLETSKGVEGEIRERFTVVQEGEHVAVIVDERGTATNTNSELPWYKKFWSAIMRKK